VPFSPLLGAATWNPLPSRESVGTLFHAWCLLPPCLSFTCFCLLAVPRRGRRVPRPQARREAQWKKRAWGRWGIPPTPFSREMNVPLGVARVRPFPIETFPGSGPLFRSLPVSLLFPSSPVPSPTSQVVWWPPLANVKPRGLPASPQVVRPSPSPAFVMYTLMRVPLEVPAAVHVDPESRGGPPPTTLCLARSLTPCLRNPSYHAFFGSSTPCLLQVIRATAPLPKHEKTTAPCLRVVWVRSHPFPCSLSFPCPTFVRLC